VRQKKLRKTQTSSEAQKGGEKLMPQVRHKIREKLIPQVRQKKWRKTHDSSESQKSREKLIPQVRHKKEEKNVHLK
jgi:hypothetical protein